MAPDRVEVFGTPHRLRILSSQHRDHLHVHSCSAIRGPWPPPQSGEPSRATSRISTPPRYTSPRPRTHRSRTCGRVRWDCAPSRPSSASQSTRYRFTAETVNGDSIGCTWSFGSNRVGSIISASISLPALLVGSRNPAKRVVLVLVIRYVRTMARGASGDGACCHPLPSFRCGMTSARSPSTDHAPARSARD